MKKVRIILAEKDLEWIKHHVSLPDKENLKPEYLKLNPLSVVPTLIDKVSEKPRREHQWLVGDEFSLADICVAPYFQTPHQFEWTVMYEQGFPKVTDWYARCRARDSYQSSVAADFSEEKLDELRAKGREGWPKIYAHLAAV